MTWRFFLVLAVASCAGLTLPAFANGGIVFIAGLVVIDIVIALAFNFLFSVVGILSFGQAGFVLVGAYGAGLLIKYAKVSMLPALLAAGVVSGLVALAIGVVALRRAKGVYFAVLSLAFASLGYVSVGKFAALGREDGINGIDRPAIDLLAATIPLSAGDRLYAFIIVVCALLVAAIWLATHSQLGRALKAGKLDPDRAAFLGIDVDACRLAAFVFAGAVTGIASALIGPWTQIVTPDLGHWVQSTKPLLHALLGGSAFFWGPALGAVLFAALAYMTRTLSGVSDVVTGGLLMLVVLVLPGGVLGISRSLARLVRGGSLRPGPS